MSEELSSYDKLKEVGRLARGLAKGVVDRKWDFSIYAGESGWIGGSNGQLFDYIDKEWGGYDAAEYGRLLLALGYLSEHGSGGNYRITEQAFALLDTPAYGSIFISYKRSESSAFALLLRERLRMEDVDAFVDIQKLNPGEEWEKRLKRAISELEAFACLINGKTLSSSNVCNEIMWALERKVIEENFPVISIWHNQFDYQRAIESFPDLNSEIKDFLVNSYALIVSNEDVSSYDTVIRQLIQYLKLPR